MRKEWRWILVTLSIFVFISIAEAQKKSEKFNMDGYTEDGTLILPEKVIDKYINNIDPDKILVPHKTMDIFNKPNLVGIIYISRLDKVAIEWARSVGGQFEMTVKARAAFCLCNKDHNGCRLVSFEIADSSVRGFKTVYECSEDLHKKI